ncbi:MAG: hypothetical protein ABSC64_12860 [Candidatus Korobacteraceae bacterium]|jgi:hypothetical protein
MGTSSKDWKNPERALLTYCTNLDCLKAFHLAPRSEDETNFFHELLLDTYYLGPAKLSLICPYCGAFLEVLTSTLEICTCGQEPHSPPYNAFVRT